MAADNKSSLVQIAQAVLDQTTQSIKISGNISVPPPEGAATEAKQEEQLDELQAIKGHIDGVEASLSSIDTKVSTLSVVGSGAATNALRVQLAEESLSALENINVIVTNSALEITNDAGNPIPISGTVSVTGVATSANQTSQITELQAIKGNTARLDYVGRVRLVYSSTNVTTGAWVELLASVGAISVKEIEIFDSSGETLELGIGASGSEVPKSYVIPGGNSKIPLQIAANGRLAIRAVSATANSGEILVNLYG